MPKRFNYGNRKPIRLCEFYPPPIFHFTQMELRFFVKKGAVFRFFLKALSELGRLRIKVGHSTTIIGDLNIVNKVPNEVMIQFHRLKPAAVVGTSSAANP